MAEGANPVGFARQRWQAVVRYGMARTQQVGVLLLYGGVYCPFGQLRRQHLPLLKTLIQISLDKVLSGALVVVYVGVTTR